MKIVRHPVTQRRERVMAPEQEGNVYAHHAAGEPRQVRWRVTDEELRYEYVLVLTRKDVERVREILRELEGE